MQELPVEVYELEPFFNVPDCNPPRWMLMLRAYLDETFEDKDKCAWVCGHLGSKESWTEFVPKWNAALGKNRTRLHMVSLRWGKPSTERLLARLGPIPALCGMQPVVSGVKFPDYADLVSGTEVEKISAGYLLSIIRVTTAVLFSIPDNERVEFVFENRGDENPKNVKLEHTVMRAMNLTIAIAGADPRLCTRDGKHKMANWSFVPKDDCMLFDQADYLCYATLQHYRDEQSKKAKWCAPILQKNEEAIGGGLASRDEIRDTIAKAFPDRVRM